MSRYMYIVYKLGHQNTAKFLYLLLPICQVATPFESLHNHVSGTLKSRAAWQRVLTTCRLLHFLHFLSKRKLFILFAFLILYSWLWHCFSSNYYKMHKKHSQGETQVLKLFINWCPFLWNTTKLKKQNFCNPKINGTWSAMYSLCMLKSKNFLELSFGVFKGL